jgi:septal ring factor EnvC (AmiA/AmiB activator)
MSPETCTYHAQFDNEIKQLIEGNAEMKADVRNITYAVGRVEKAIETMHAKIDCVEKEQSNQRVADAKQDGRINVMWTFLIEKNGLLLIGIMAYLVLGKAW